MSIEFVKMSGAGNDFVMIDHRDLALAGRERDVVRLLCDRREGIGADGVILLEDDAELDFRVRFFNPDGGEYGLCGNGARCLPAFAEEIGLPGSEYSFRSPSGVHRARRCGDGSASVLLRPVANVRLDVEVELDGRAARMDWGDIGVPHGVFWVDDVDTVPIASWGAQLRHARAFAPDGTNVSFARATDGGLAVRTFERGVEGETLACGSGSAVVATVARRRELVGDVVRLSVRSGETLVVRLPADEGGAPELEGPCRRVFSGVFSSSPPVR